MHMDRVIKVARPNIAIKDKKERRIVLIITLCVKVQLHCCTDSIVTIISERNFYLLPPSSSVTLVKFFAAACITSLPTALPPV